VAEVARTRYYEPTNMVAARIAAADPVVTSNVDRLRFESFSACAGVYARLDLEPGVLDGRPRAWGTTNVDFNPPMRAALARVHDDEAMLMHVGHDEVRVETLEGSAVEKRVPLPERWVKGFAEVQVASAHMVQRHELPAVEARRFLRSLPRTRSRTVAWATPAGRGLRLSSRPSDAAACVAGPERLRLLEKLLPFAKTLRVYGPPPGRDRHAEPGAWELELDGARVVFALSPELFRGFSGEGGVLADLAHADEQVVDEVADSLQGEPEIDVAEVSRATGIAKTSVQTALGALGAAGRVGYDLAQNAFFHRELPYDRRLLETMNPRLLGASSWSRAQFDSPTTEEGSSAAATRSTSFGSRTAWRGARVRGSRSTGGSAARASTCSRFSRCVARRPSRERRRPRSLAGVRGDGCAQGAGTPEARQGCAGRLRQGAAPGWAQPPSERVARRGARVGRNSDGPQNRA
jgi:hypothetical protein